MPETIVIDTETLWIILIFISSLLVVSFFLLPRIISWGIITFFSPDSQEIYRTIISPYYSQLGLAFLLIIVDLILLNFARLSWLKIIEIPLAITVVILLTHLGQKILSNFFKLIC